MSIEALRPSSHTARVNAAALALALAAGCGSNNATPVTTDVPAATDAGAGDGGACADFSGGWALTGTCSVPGFSPFPVACITQTGCAATVVVSAGSLPGTIAGNTLTFGTSVSGIPLECTVTRSGASLTASCVAAGGAATCTATGAPIEFPGATRFCCDVSAQDCGAGRRCNIISSTTTNNDLLTACVPSGAVADGAACARAGGRVGAEDCAQGLFCANYNNATAASRTCQRLCRSASDCRAGEGCVSVTDTPRTGVCLPPCTLNGTDCAAGTCRPVNTFQSATTTAFVNGCFPVGAAAAGASCAQSPDCGANLACRGGVCRAVCDATHACPMGQSCMAYTGTNPAGSGTCM